MIQRLDHIAITVRDLKEAIDFYDKLGFKLGQRSENPTQIIQFLESGYARLEVFAPKVPVTTPADLSQSDVGIKHIALKVDDIWKTYEEAKAKGVVFNENRERSLMDLQSSSSKTPVGYFYNSYRSELLVSAEY